jgi:hypothetical protein
MYVVFLFFLIHIFSYAANYRIEGEASFRVTIWLIVSPEGGSPRDIHRQVAATVSLTSCFVHAGSLYQTHMADQQG